MMRTIERRNGAFGTRWAGKVRKALLIAVVLGSLAAPAAGVFEGDAELLKLTALAQRDNIRKIATWEGSSSVEESSGDANGVTIRETSAFHFIYSRDHQATRWEWKGQSRYVRPGLTVGGRLVDPNWWSNWANEMRKGDSFYVYTQNRIRNDGQKQASLVIWPSRKAREGVHSYSFDPMWYLNGRVTAGADDLADLLMEYYEQSSDQSFRESDCTLKVNRDADLVIFETRGKDILNRFVFDLSKGGSPIKVLIESGMGTQTREWTYEQRADVWIPKSFTKTSQWLQPRPNGETKDTRKVTFTENALNRPVAVAEFSLAKLGVKIGDPVSDHRRGVFYHYEGVQEENRR
jgi:hypothetical protein